MMRYANTDTGKSLPEPHMQGRCPMCDGKLIAKCGEINVRHWAHESLDDCDSWSEGETEWHLGWKSFFPPEIIEITETKNGEKHRADVKLSSGLVLEFQNSSISPEEIRERNSFWGNVIWIFNARHLTPYLFDWNRSEELEIDFFRWRHSKKTISDLDFFVLDRGPAVFCVEGVEWDVSPVEGCGHYMNKFTFLLNNLNIIQEWANVGITKYFDYRSLSFLEKPK